MPNRGSHRLPLRVFSSLLIWACSTWPLSLASQESNSGGAIVPGPEYQASGVHRFFFGADYRDLWTAPIEVEILDLSRAGGGGLTPVGTGGGFQTLNLRFVGADGLPYTFRALNKDPTKLLPSDLQGTFAAELVQDQISSAFPSAPPVVDALLEAVAIPSRKTRIVVLPDDPRLGSYREQFAGRIGTFEQWANEGPDGTPGFANATDVIDSDELTALLRADPDQRVDLPAFLSARLMDIFVGDWDRHRGQWRWGNVGAGNPPSWVPFPEDRDQAFARYDGLILWLSSRKFAPQLTRFGSTYPAMTGATWNGRDLDRWLLPHISRGTWDSVAASVQAALTDSVLENAVRRLPPTHLALRGDYLRNSLRQRRDDLLLMAENYYRHVVSQIDLRLSDAPEVADIARHEDGSVTLSLYNLRDGPRDRPYLTTDYHQRLTREIRLHLRGGDDSVVVRGARSGITLRVISERGRNTVVDSSRAGGLVVYDSRPDSLTVSPSVKMDRRRWQAPVVKPGELPRRDWGSFSYPQGLVSWSIDLGLLLTGTFEHVRFGFRQQPHAQKHGIGAAFSFKKVSGRLSYLGSFVRRGTEDQVDLRLLASGIETNNFYGFGNSTDSRNDSDFFTTDQRDFQAELAYRPLLTSGLRGTVGVRSRFTATETDEADFVSLALPYGSDDFGQVGAIAALDLDLVSQSRTATSGLRARVGGAYYPVVLTAADSGAFGNVDGFVAGHITPLRSVTLALRVGGQKSWGRFPFHESAFLGGESSLRGYRQQRFAGDASLYLNSDLRLSLGGIFLLVPAEIGLLGLFDAGRVWYQGASTGDIHLGAGGGLYLAPLGRRTNALVATVAGGDDGAQFAFHMGFAF